MIRKIIERRSRARRGVYLWCAALVLLFAIGSAGMEDGLIGILPYLPVVAICVAQFLRPTLLGWFALTGAFSAYAVSIAVSFRAPVHEFMLFLSIGVLPAVALLWAWPKPLETVQKSEPGMTTA